MVKSRHRSPCATVPPPFHEDDCAGCQSFIDCAKQTDGFSAECWCESCFWMGTWDECIIKRIPQTWMDPEEVYYKCPNCHEDVEDVND